MHQHAAVVCLLLLVSGYVIAAVDDLLFDLIYWVESGRKKHRGVTLSEGELDALPELRIALMTAAWHEHGVIEHMLRYNEKLIEYENYEIFIGTYPNDQPTQDDVDAASRDLPRVHKVVNPTPGPTTKADNLNAILDVIRAHEVKSGVPFDLVMLHDPEDVIHPLELKVVNWHFSTHADLSMAQLPIYPLPVPASQFTAGTYLDEFAELHTKGILVREWIHGFIPSAGVATTWRRRVLDVLAETSEDGKAFSVGSLTEDYDVGLKVHLAGLKAAFIRQFVCRDVRSEDDHAIRPRRADAIRNACAFPERTELVATRAHFPETVQTSVRQRTRWTLGIVFQAWKNWGWVGDIRTRYLLMHDRKGPFSYMIVLLGYLFAGYLLVHYALRKTAFPYWQPVLPGTRTVGISVMIGTMLMAHRLLERAIATTRVFGGRQGALAVVRQPWNNLINLAATYRAARQFIVAQREGRVVQWDKTQHHVPGVVTR